MPSRVRNIINVVIGGLLAVSCAQPRGTATTPSIGPDTTFVLSFERAIEQAQVRKDLAFLDSAADPSLRFIHGGATLSQSKAEWLQSVAASTFYKRDVDEQHADLHGDVAVTSGRIHIERRFHDPTQTKYTISYVRVYRCGANSCRLLSHTTTASTLLDSTARPPDS